MTLSRDIRIQIVTLKRNTSKSDRQIGRELGISKTSVASVMQLYEETGSVENHEIDNRGGLCKLDDRTRRHLVMESKKDPQKSAREIQHAVGGNAMNVGLRTIQRVLVEEDRKCYRPLRGMVLTKAHKEKRLSWANIHLELNFNDFWSQVSV